MNRTEILEILKEILSGEEGLVLAEFVPGINEETSLLSDLVMDSLQILNLIVLIEERFNFVCSEDELSLDLFDKVENIIDFIISNTKNKE
jgi:hypothetical protein